ncbi:hypothetical protein C9I98_05020 [Photobacterium sanctipauli]|uniref:Transcriptional regulator n=1 Tax=Photobacterium sanctipauli TaxID=1342794 RepID=A0A2T3NYF0_9GAMM|nr:MalM family protein [Photobacterium sanctipauli]PSW21304.1 hypothetical protein C9I98_05020 [Photobacterium sanctipauli]
MLKLKQTLLAISLLASLSGCSTPSSTELMPITETHHCCVELGTLTQAATEMDSHHYFALDGRSALTGTPEHPTPTQVFRLAKQDSPQEINVTAFIAYKKAASIKILLLDETGSPVKTINQGDFTYQPAALGKLEQLHYRLVIDTSTKDHPHFIVIQTDYSAVGHQQPLIHPEELYAEKQAVIPSLRIKEYAELTPVGVIEITSNTVDGAAWPVINKISANNQVEQAAAIPSQPWAEYRTEIDSALQENNFKHAALLAEEASQDGYSEAKDYLIQKMAEHK